MRIRRRMSDDMNSTHKFWNDLTHGPNLALFVLIIFFCVVSVILMVPCLCDIFADLTETQQTISSSSRTGISISLNTIGTPTEL